MLEMITREAEELNDFLSPEVANLLSSFGKEAYYPKSGIPGQTMEAQGTRINATLGQAFTNERVNNKLVPLTLPSFERAQKELKEGEIFSYAPTHGIAPLREEWKIRIYIKNYLSLDHELTSISTPVAVGGIAHGLTLVNELFVNERDELIHFDPFWGNYKLHFRNAIMKPIPINEGLGLNLSGLEQALSGFPKKRIVLLNFPSNPTGYVPSWKEKSDLQEILVKAAERGNSIVTISDDAYFGLNYASERFNESPFALFANAHENILAIKADGATKECFAWGLRLGFLTYAKKGMSAEEAKSLEDKTAGRVRASISNVATASQWTAYYGLQSPTFFDEVDKNKKVLQRRWSTIQEILKENPQYEEEFSAKPFHGGYFMCLELKKDPERIRKILREEYSTGVLSLTNTSLLRIAYSAVPNNDLPELYENIYRACQKA